MDFTLRPFCAGDIKSIALHADNRAIARFMRNGFKHPFSRKDAESLVDMLMRAPLERTLVRAICVEDCAVGSIGVFVQEDIYSKTADIAYWLAEPYWGCGIMTRAVLGMCRAAFERFDIVRIQAEPFSENIASHRVLEKAGFQKEGTLRSRIYKDEKLQDAFVFALLRSDFMGGGPDLFG